MPGIDFNYSGLGEAYRVFSQKHARLLDVRRDLEAPLAAHVQHMENSLKEHRAVEPVAGVGLHHMSGHALDANNSIDILHLYDQDREWKSRVLRTVREMELAYLVAMADAFIGRWREENGLPAGRRPDDDRWHAATVLGITTTLADLHNNHRGIPLLTLRPDVAERLESIRNRRNAVMHRDSEGVDEIAEADVDQALSTLNTIARALAFVTHGPVSHDRDGSECRAFMAEALLNAHEEPIHD